MSCRCCQPGGDSSSEEEFEDEEISARSLLLSTSIEKDGEESFTGLNGQPDAAQEEKIENRVQALADLGITRIPAAYIRPLNERPQNAVALEGIPVVDLSENREAIAVEIGRACKDWGFFQVVNHGVSSELLEAMRRDGRAFFELPMNEKLQYACKPGTIASEGYGSKMLVKDEQVLDWRDYLDLHTLPLSRREISNWPANPSSFRKTVENYSEEMRLLAERLLALISESLGLPSSHIISVIGAPSQNVSVNYYPACPQPDLTLGLQSHSDLGAITILMQADIAGLQVCKNGNWIAVQPLTDALVVNLGDMMEVLSNGRYRSVEHRAVVNDERDRLSVATFLDPAKDQLLSPASALINDCHPLLYKEVLFRDFISAWYSKGPDGKRNVDNLVISR